MSEEKLVPKLRFKEFTDGWSENILSNICEINPRTEVPEKFNYIDLESVNSGILTQIKEINKEEAPSRAQRKLNKNDILFATVRPYQQNNYYFNLDGDYVASTGYAQLRSLENPEYLYYFIHTKKFLNDVLKRCTGTSYPAINSNDLKTIKIKKPSISEQEKIASFFSKLDKKIELLKQKYQHFQDFKKYLMQQIFVQKLRFDGFKEEWIQTTIDDLFETITDYVAAGSFADIRKNVQYQKEGYAQLIRTADLKNNFKNDDFVYVNQHAFEYLYRVNLNEKCIVLPNIGNVGEVYFVNPNDLPHEHNVLAPNAILLKSFKNIEFKYHLLNSSYFKNQLDIINESAGRGKFNKTNLKKIKLFVPPTRDEQNKIATFLSSTDQKIELMQKQVSQMEEFKKGLLQSMFV